MKKKKIKIIREIICVYIEIELSRIEVFLHLSGF